MIRKTIVVAASISFLGALATSGLAHAGGKAEPTSQAASGVAAAR